MTKKRVIGIVVGVLMCVGVGMGLEQLRQFFKPVIVDEVEFEETPVKIQPQIIKDERAEYEAERLRREVDSLRRTLAARDRAVAASLETLAPDAEVAVDDTANRRGGGG
ncbi:MAG: hypothetical protein FWH21_08005, partial [Kiritimatiellaeota bacterium]|nr:hypothetical protein [Kiritimatiellota bacterium]